MKASRRVAGPTRESGGEGEGHPLLGVVEVDRGGRLRVAPGRHDLRRGDLELGGVEHDLVRGDPDGHVDLHLAGEGGGAQVRRQGQPVGVGQDRGRQTVGGRVVGREPGGRSAHAGQATVAPCLPTSLPSRILPRHR